jgi:hypothetical protein
VGQPPLSPWSHHAARGLPGNRPSCHIEPVDELSRAVMLCSVSYLESRAVLEAEPSDAFGNAANELTHRARAVLQKTFTISAGWTSEGELAQDAELVKAEVIRRHPDLSPEAAQAAANYWAFCNR